MTKDLSYGEGVTDQNLGECLSLNMFTAIYQILADMVSQVDINALLERLVQLTRNVFHSDIVILFIYNEEKGHLIPRASSCTPSFEPYVNIFIRPGEGAAGLSYASQRSVRLSNYEEWEDRYLVGQRNLSRLGETFAVPISQGGSKVIGSMTISFEEGARNVPKEAFLQLQLLANIASLALENAYERSAVMALNKELVRHNERQEANLLLTENTLFRRNVELMDLLKELEQVQLKERRKIANDLHDDALQYLYGVNSLLQSASVMIDKGDYGAVRNTCKIAQKYISSAEAAIRSLLSDLREQTTDSEFSVAVSDYVEMLKESVGFEVHFETDGALPVISVDAQMEALRVIQESVSNVEEHACAANLWLGLHRKGDNVEIVVSDDGVGMELKECEGKKLVLKANHYGMQIMYERSASVGASLQIESKLGEGTTITMVIPGTPEEL